MIRDGEHNLTEEEIIKLLKDMKVKFDPNLSRDELEQILVEQLDEESEENRMESHFEASFLQDRYLEMENIIFSNEPSLEEISVDFLVFLQRDLTWLYAQWHFSERSLENFALNSIKKLSLQLFSKKQKWDLDQEVEFTLKEENWSFYMPDANQFYKVKIVSRAEGKEDVLLESKSIFLSNINIRKDFNENNEILCLSGIEELVESALKEDLT